jgi:outer membrane lipoprotein LolB
MALACVLVIAAGCKTLPRDATEFLSVPATAWPERRTTLQSLDRFTLSGRIAVAAGEQGFSGPMRYAQRGAAAELNLDGPLGVGGLRIEWRGADLQVRTSKGELLDGMAARAELERRVGFALPLERLRFWLLGVPDPGVPSVESLVAEDRLGGLQQDGWRIDYTAYGDASRLPQRLTAQREGARVRVALDRWER